MSPAPRLRRPGRHRAPLAPLLSALLGLGCATAGRHASGSPGLVFQDPAVVEASAADAGLASRNDEELFAIGSAAAQAGDPARAAAAFGRLGDAFPGSRYATEARTRAGLAWRQLERWDLARERFREAADHGIGAEASEARFLEAECLYHLGRLDEAGVVLDRLTSLAELPGGQRVRALTQAGVLAFERGEPAAAERSLLQALEWARAAEREERPGDRYYPAKAAFYLGELSRSAFEAAAVDSGAEDVDLAAERLEGKSRRLLEAQERYLAAVSAGDPRWAVAAGARIGELYETLHRELLEAPVPPALEGEPARAYRLALRARLRPLVVKAMEAYRETLSAARHAGVDDAWASRAEEALRRMQLLLDETDRDPVPLGRREEGGDQRQDRAARARERSGYMLSSTVR